MIERARKNKKFWSLLLCMLLIIQVVTPVLGLPSYAEESEESVYSLTQSIRYTDDQKPASTVSPEQMIQAHLKYSISPTTYNVYNTEIEFQLPPGAVYDSVIKNPHIINEEPYYNPGTNTVTFKLIDVTGDGISGSIDVNFYFPLPSVYTNGKLITLKGWKATGNLDAIDGVEDICTSNTSNITYSIEDSWILEKTGLEAAVISNNTSQTELEITYWIELRDGNINLKDVDITDTLPPDAIFKSTSLKETSYDEGTGKIIWHFDDVIAGNDERFNITLGFPIKRNPDDVGVVATNQRTNTVSVSGSAVEIQSDGSFAKVPYYTFKQHTDSVTTTFNASTAEWSVDTNINESNPVVLSKDIFEPEVVVDYLIDIKDGDVDLEDIQLVYDIPTDAAFVAATMSPSTIYTSDKYTEVYNPENHQIIWEFADIYAANELQISVQLAYDIDRGEGDDTGNGVKDGSQRINIITAYDNSKFGSFSDQVITNFVLTDEKWRLAKTGPSSITVPNFSDDDFIDLDYTILLASTGSGDFNEKLSSVTISETLPEGVVIVESSPEPDLVDGNSWTFLNVDGNDHPSVDLTVRYPIDRNTGTGYRPDDEAKDEIINVATVVAYPYELDHSPSSDPYTFDSGYDSSSVTTSLTSPTPPNPNISLDMQCYDKDLQLVNYNNDRNLNTGDNVFYLININNNNHNNHVLKESMLIVDNLSSTIDYIEIYLGETNATYAIDYVFEYKTNKKSWTQHLGTLNTSVATIVKIEDLILDDGEYITGIRFNYCGDIEKDFTYKSANKVKLSGVVKDSTADKTNVSNKAKLEYKYEIFEDLSNIAFKEDELSFKVLIDTAWISTLSKVKLGGDNENTNHYTSTEIDYKITLGTNEKLATDGLTNPKIVDVIPAGFKIKEDSITYSGVPNPFVTTYIDYPNVGDTTVVWSWDGYELPEGSSIVINYTLEIEYYASVGTYYNRLYAYGDGTITTPYTTTDDAEDVDKDIDVDESVIVGTPSKINVLETAALSSSKWVKGELDDEYNRQPDVARTTPGGSSDYRLELQNAGNVPVKKLEVVDILPSIGDSYVLSTTDRNSQWRPYLIEEFTQGFSDVVYSVDDPENPTAANVAIEYSTASDPIRKNSKGQDIGTQEPNWSTTPPSDITNVHSLRFVIKDFNGVDGTLDPGSTVILNWKMRSPLGAPITANDAEVDNYIPAWNSFKMQAITINHLSLPEEQLPAESRAVGIIVNSNPLGEIGDFVWFDKKADGKQNDGYDDESAGINGITVTLFKRDTADGVYKEAGKTLTGPDQQGRPGYYLFTNLETGDYFVSFELPEHYKMTLPNQGTDDTTDSDGTDDIVGYEGTIRTQSVHINTDDPDAKSYHDLDLGVISNIDYHPSINLTKEAIGYIDADGRETLFDGTKVPININEKVLYKITIHNDGNIPLNNIRIEDVMDNNGFTFTKATYIDADDKPFNYDSLSEDPNIKSTVGNIVVINRLEASDSYELFAEYLVIEADYNNGAINNKINVWANELKDKTDPTNPPCATDDESLELAAMRLEKTVTQIKKKDAIKYIDVVSPSEVGVEVGDTIRYQVEVFNVGSINLTDVKVNDPLVSLTDHNIDLIEVGKSATIKELDYVVQNDDLPGPIKNTVTATQDDIRQPVADSVDVDFKGLTITKTVAKINGEVAVSKDGKYIVNVGDNIEYSILFKNTDDVALQDVRIVKDELTSSRNLETTPDILAKDVLVVAELEVGQEIEHFINYTVTVDDLNPDGNTAVISNHVYGKSLYTSIKESSVNVHIAALTIEKTADVSSFRRIDDPIEFTITVTNQGTVDLHNVKVVDNLLSIDDTIDTLSVNASIIYTGIYNVTEEDYKAYKVINIATGNCDETDEVQDDVTVKRWVSSTGGGIILEPEEPEPEPETPQQEPETPRPEEITKEPDGTTIYNPPTGTAVIEIVDEPSHGTIEIDKENNVIYTPNEGAPKYDRFTVIINKDGEDILLEIEIFDEDIAGGLTELPETGGTSSYLFYIFGILIMGIGIYLKPNK